MSTEAFLIPGGMAAESTPGHSREVELRNRVPSPLSVRTRHGRVVIPPLGQCKLEEKDLDVEALMPAQCAGVLEIVTSDYGEESANAWSATFVAAANAMKEAISQLPGRLKELVVFSLVVAIVFALPGAILYFGSDVHGLWNAAHQPGGHAQAVALIGIGVQFFCIVGASALPVLLYFMFDRERLLTLRRKVTRHIFRLDPAMKTLTDFDARYGQWLDEAFGCRSSETRYLPGTRWPILIATSVITLGWAVALLDTKPVEGSTIGTLTALMQPTPAAPTYAFLGAYFFTLNSVLRGFVRGDLRPKTYAQIATRIVGAVVLAFTIERMLRGVGGDSSSASLLIFAFIVGVVPETFLIRMQETARGFARTRSGRKATDHASRTYETEPLTRLQGIDIYDRARLLDEGVTNVEGLAHHDLVELLLKTRIPASRLVDWIDQAILFIHCSRDADGPNGDGPSPLTELRAHGIRTATGLRRAYNQAPDKKAFERIVTTPEGKPPVIPVLLSSIAQEDWMSALVHWHEQPLTPRTIKVPEAYA